MFLKTIAWPLKYWPGGSLKADDNGWTSTHRRKYQSQTARHTPRSYPETGFDPHRRGKCLCAHCREIKDDSMPPHILSAMPEPCRQSISISGGGQALFTIQALTPIFFNYRRTRNLYFNERPHPPENLRRQMSPIPGIAGQKPPHHQS